MLAAAIVENLQAAGTGAPHEFPIFEIIGSQVARRLVVTRVVREHLIAKIETHHAAQHLPIRPGNGHHFAVSAKLTLQCFEVAFGHGGGAVAVDIVGIQCKKPVDSGVNVAGQTVLDPFSNHGSLLAGDCQHIGLVIGCYAFAECDVKILRRPVRVALIYVAQLKMCHAKTGCYGLRCAL